MIAFNKRKDKIAIIAPSSLPEDAEKVFNSAVSFLENNGFAVTYHPEIFSRKTLDFFAAKKHIRIEGLRYAMDDPDVKIIWGFRGGYGATEIVFDFCDFKPSSKKLLIGFSDITALHALFNNIFHMPSLHAPVLTSILGAQSANFSDIITLFEKGSVQYKLIPLNEAAANVNSSIRSKITGGNLAVLCNLIGTKLHPNTTDKILILEDVWEKGYQIHRYFMHLFNAGLLDNPSAIILGDFTKGDRHVQPALDDICYRYLQLIPVYRITGLGHGDVNNPIVLGTQAKIADNKLSFASPLEFVN